MIIGEGGEGAGPAAVEVTAATFQAEVLQESMKRPVVVDLWAPWCGPCKQLAPVLEKAVAALKGKVKLVKVNIDDEPQIAQMLRVQSIPAVFAFDQGQPVDGFAGAQPASQIKAFLERLAGPAGPDPLEQALEQAQRLLDEGAFEQAAALFERILAHDSGHIDAIAGRCRALIGLGRADDARRLLAGLDGELAGDARIQGVQAQLALLADAPGDLAGLEAKVAAAGHDFAARLELARAYAACDRRVEAVDQLIAIVATQRDWNDEAARKELLKFFEAWGPTDEATLEGRRKLSSAWFR